MVKLIPLSAAMPPLFATELIIHKQVRISYTAFPLNHKTHSPLTRTVRPCNNIFRLMAADSDQN